MHRHRGSPPQTQYRQVRLDDDDPAPIAVASYSDETLPRFQRIDGRPVAPMARERHHRSRPRPSARRRESHRRARRTTSATSSSDDSGPSDEPPLGRHLSRGAVR